jgi:acetoin utilization deacetylase AcuC-like enzyme
MQAPRRVGIVEDPRFRDHAGPPGHPERPERLQAVGEAIEARRNRLIPVAARGATPDEILRTHDRAHLAHLEEASRQAPLRLDPDTYLGRESLDVARLAAGGAVDLVRAVCRGELDAGLAAIRPPGHHAESDRAMGFCLFNNIAIAARAAQADEGVGRVLLLDWDVHHGNGTQHVFESDPTILYASLHQFPYYPGTGAVGECGVGRGEGATLNVPLPAGSGDSTYLGVMQRVLVPAAMRFRPELLLVSCGFDAHHEDPLAAMEVTREGFLAMAQLVRALADDLCHGRLVLLLEGGYALSGLREGTGAALDALLDATARPPADVRVAPDPSIERLLERISQVHGKNFSRLGAL